MGKKAREAIIKDKMKQEKEAKRNNVNPDQVFHSKMIVGLMELNLHMETVYKLIKIKHIDQMLATMWESTVKQYKLHEPTIIKLQDSKFRQEVEDLIFDKLGRKLKIKV